MHYYSSLLTNIHFALTLFMKFTLFIHRLFSENVVFFYTDFFSGNVDFFHNLKLKFKTFRKKSPSCNMISLLVAPL